MSRVHPETKDEEVPMDEGLSDDDETPPIQPRSKNKINLSEGTRAKEIEFLVESVQTKLADISHSESWEKRKTLLYSISFVCSIMGTFMILYGLSITVLFAANKPNIAMAAVGGLFYIPAIATFIYFVFPSKKDKVHRKEIREKSRIRNQDSFLTDMMMDASKRAKPPERTVRLVAIVRGSVSFPRQEIMVLGTTVRNLLADIEKATGLPMNQQVVKLNGVELTKNLDQHFVHDLHLVRDTELLVFNRGRYEMAVIEKHHPQVAFKHMLAPAPESWEAGLTRQWNGDKVKEHTVLSSQPTKDIETGSMSGNGFSSGNSVVSIADSSVFGSLTGKVGSIANDNRTVASIANSTHKSSVQSKTAWK